MEGHLDPPYIIQYCPPDSHRVDAQPPGDEQTNRPTEESAASDIIMESAQVAGIEQDPMESQCAETDTNVNSSEVAIPGETQPFIPETEEPVTVVFNPVSINDHSATYVYQLEDLSYEAPQFVNVYSEVTVSSTSLSPQKQTSSKTAQSAGVESLDPDQQDMETEIPAPQDKRTSKISSKVKGQRAKRKPKKTRIAALQAQTSKEKALNSSTPSGIQEKRKRARKPKIAPTTVHTAQDSTEKALCSPPSSLQEKSKSDHEPKIATTTIRKPLGSTLGAVIEKCLKDHEPQRASAVALQAQAAIIKEKALGYTPSAVQEKSKRGLESQIGPTDELEAQASIREKSLGSTPTCSSVAEKSKSGLELEIDHSITLQAPASIKEKSLGSTCTPTCSSNQEKRKRTRKPKTHVADTATLQSNTSSEKALSSSPSGVKEKKKSSPESEIGTTIYTLEALASIKEKVLGSTPSSVQGKSKRTRKPNIHLAVAATAALQANISNEKALSSSPSGVQEKSKGPHEPKKPHAALKENEVIHDTQSVSTVGCQTPFVFEDPPVGKSANMGVTPDSLSFIMVWTDLCRISGVAAKRDLAVGDKFGPFTGNYVKRLHSDYNPSAWEVCVLGQTWFYIDGKSDQTNWMQMVQPARYKEEQNVEAFQFYGNVYFRTTKPIVAGSELKVFYSEDYRKSVGFKTDLNDLTFDKESQKFRCPNCDCQYPKAKTLLRHIKFEHDKETSRVFGGEEPMIKESGGELEAITNMLPPFIEEHANDLRATNRVPGEPDQTLDADDIPDEVIGIEETSHGGGKYNLRNRDSIIPKWREKLGFDHADDDEAQCTESDLFYSDDEDAVMDSDESDLVGEMAKRDGGSKVTARMSAHAERIFKQDILRILLTKESTETNNALRNKHPVVETDSSGSKSAAEVEDSLGNKGAAETEDISECLFCDICQAPFSSEEQLESHEFLVHKRVRDNELPTEIAGKNEVSKKQAGLKQSGRPRKSKLPGELDCTSDIHVNNLPNENEHPSEIADLKEASKKQTGLEHRGREGKPKQNKEPAELDRISDTVNLPNEPTVIIIEETNKGEKYNLRNRDKILPRWKKRVGFEAECTESKFSDNEDNVMDSDESNLMGEMAERDGGLDVSVTMSAHSKKSLEQGISGEVRDGNPRKLIPRVLLTKEKLEKNNILRNNYSGVDPSGSMLTSEHEDTNEFVSCKKRPAHFSSEDELKSHNEKKRRGGKHVCKECGFRCRDGKDFSEHLLLHDVTVYRCQKCDCSFRGRHRYGAHVRHFHKLSNERKLKRVEPGKPKRNCVPYAKDNENLPQDLRGIQRVASKHPRKFTCRYCGKKFTTKLSQDTHEKTIHLNTGAFKCKSCPKTFMYIELLQVHESKHTKKYYFQCSKCPQSFASEKALHNHQKKHDEHRPFKCDQCDKRFTSLYYVKKHIAGVHERPDHSFECRFCGKYFKYKNSRNLHENNHRGIRDFVCDYCGKAFYTKQTLHVHMLTHTGERKFDCKVCGKMFSMSRDVVIHIKRHHKHEGNNDVKSTDS